MHTIILETERLILRQHAIIDRDAYCSMEMDADVRRFVGGHPRKREDAEKRFAVALQPVGNGLGMWAAILKSESKYIGRCGVYPHLDSRGLPIPGEASIGLYIAKDYWGHGYATEAGKALVQLGFEILQLGRIVAMVQVENDASAKVLTKLGFKLIKTEEGEWRNFHHFILER